MTVVGRVGDADLLAAARQTRTDVILVGQKAKDERAKYGQLLRLRRPPAARPPAGMVRLQDHEHRRRRARGCDSAPSVWSPWNFRPFAHGG
jgi:hypothetical protein